MSQTEKDVDDLVAKVVGCKPRPRILHIYLGPFVVVYALLLNLLYSIALPEEAPGLWLFSIAGTVILHAVTYLSCYWSVDMKYFLQYSKINDPSLATHARVIPTPNNGSSELVQINRTTTDKGEPVTWFHFQKTKYTLDKESRRFEAVKFPVDNHLNSYLDWKGLLDENQITTVTSTYGRNILDMNIPEFKELFIERATAPFFVFQVFCVCLWCLDEFWYYALLTLGMLVVFECVLVYQQLRNLSEIRKMGNKPYSIYVYRNRKWRLISTQELLPGDVVSVTRHQEQEYVPCDLLLLHGSCIVDESLLTGESVPQMKEPIESDNDLSRKLDIESDGRLHVLFGGTKIVQSSQPSKTTTVTKAPNNGCIAFVLRTSFNTTQGKLLRTILFSVKHVTANNLETFCFILFLLIFAIMAASYVWIEASKDPKRNKYKLFLECILILTTVVPPELPIELSLAVNTSLAALAKLYIFCTEPFRLPFAGKVNMCCFDKTGTLTSDDLVVEGVTGIKNQKNSTVNVLPINEAPPETIQVLSACHALVQLDTEVIGDPLEKAILDAIEWSLTRADAVVPRKGKSPGIRIFHRFHFSSSLKRMSVIAGYTPQGTTGTVYLGLVKGAPEVLRGMFTKVPSDYDEIYTSMSKRGARILALGRRDLGNLNHSQIREMTRESLEKNLEFAGFIVISCPLKPDSRAAVKELIESSHYVRMITGDGPLTACHVAKELNFCRQRDTLILNPTQKEKGAAWNWKAIYSNEEFELIPDISKSFYNEYDLCVTGDGINFLVSNHYPFFTKILPKIVVFARVAPKQKELIITKLKSLGYCTLMCGDGTNDVGALKHADVGVALMTHGPASAAELESKRNRKTFHDHEKEREIIREGLPRNRVSRRTNDRLANNQDNISPRTREAREELQKMLDEMREMDATLAKPGDASIAAPFTSKLSSINCVCSIIKQGRCTLVTTLQMFKILALNALILAYSHSVLYLDGVKFSDGQATLQGLLLAGCFLFISRSKPLKKLSKTRPLTNIFNVYTISTVLCQFMVHFCALVYLVNEANKLSPKKDFVDLDAEFSPSLLNSTVYVISITLQVATFAVNYKGPPFMESILENKPLSFSIVGPIVVVMFLITGAIPGIAEQFSIIDFPDELQNSLMIVVLLDISISLVVDRIFEYLFGRATLKRLP